MNFFSKLLKVFIFAICSAFICILGIYLYAYINPKLDIKNNGSLYIFDNNNNLVYQGSRSNEWVNISDMSKYLIDAVISVEDKSFYNHNGFDYIRIIKAMYLNITNKKILQGASTISQQYIKNLYLDFDKTWNRKIEEAFLTIQLETHFSKDEILEGYINTINYGQGNYGISSASSYYFNKKPSELTLEEAIILAGIPKNPNNYNPITNYDNSIKRAKIVAKSMLDNKKMDQNIFNNLFNKKIEIYGKKNNNNLVMLMYYQDAVFNELKSINTIPKSLIDSGGIKVYTNLDYEVQKNLEENIYKYKSDDDIQIASVVINPSNGGVIALTGGIDYTKSQYNRALNSKRQVGSTMKPFLYYAALENNFTMSSTFKSEPTTFNLSNGTVYEPGNAGEIYGNKDITMAAALTYSDNIYAIKTNLFLGIDKMIDVAKRTGIKEKFEEYASLPLGTKELNILDFATGYTTFASLGYKKDIHFIRKVEDKNGNVLYEKEYENNLVLNPNYTYILNEMLANTTNANFVDYTKPTALNIASKLSTKYAIKTGSTNTDYWIAGYNKDVLMVSWMGYDDNKENTNEIRNMSKNIWADTVESYIKTINSSWYEMPKNIVALPLDAITGMPTNDKKKMAMYYFVKGSNPKFENEIIVNKNN